MIRIIALSSIYLLMLYGIAAGVQYLSRSECSDWLEDCAGTDVAAMRSADAESQAAAPAAPELH